MDFITELPECEGFTSIMVVVDRYTKMAHFIPTNEKATSNDLVQLHVAHVWKLHGLPLIHHTDRGPTFTSNFTKNMFKSLGIDQRFSTAYHPQTQGQVENLNNYLETFLRMFVNHRQNDWVKFLHQQDMKCL